MQNYIIPKMKTRHKPQDYVNMASPEADTVTSRMLSVEEYRKLALRVISKWAPINMRSHMLNSEDAIDFVAHQMMMGDWKYNPEKSASIKTQRGESGRFAIKTYIRTLRNQSSEADTNSLDCENDNFHGLHEAIPDEKAVDPMIHVMNQEQQHINKTEIVKMLQYLNPNQKSCIILHYIYGKSFAEIGRIIGITREGASKVIESGMELMKKYAN